MDLVATLRNKIDALEDGDYIPGLRAVLLHIETAYRHLARGQESEDETAFTDTIYRTNQAFEGSIKEAYRVLASQDPSKKRPFDIEKYLEKSKSFRERVLRQFTTYRTEWRNPSAHDYKLDFDESEAFLAIVSVSAFACLLLDQIAEQLSFIKSQAEAEAQKATVTSQLATDRTSGLMERAVDIIQQFATTSMFPVSSSQRHSELQYIGALHGFVSSIAPDIEVSTEEVLTKDRPFRADLVFKHGSERVLIELKRDVRKSHEVAVSQVEHYMLISGIKSAILFLISPEKAELEVEERLVPAIDGRIMIVRGKKV
ncbi:hypothetical protein FHR49_001368 [Xanthomonas campestris]